MTLAEVTEHVVAYVRQNQGMALPIVFLLSFGESLAFVSLLLPATVMLLALAALFAASDVAFWPLWIAATIGAILGYGVSYWIGLVYKDRIGGVWPFATRPEMLERSRRFFDRWGAASVFLGHFSGPVRAVIPVVAGMSAMRAAPFMAANVSSSAIWAAGILSPGLLVSYWTDITTLLQGWFGGAMVR